MWTLAGQVDSLSVLPCASEHGVEEGANCRCVQMMASQPGGRIVDLIPKESRDGVRETLKTGVDAGPESNETKSASTGKNARENLSSDSNYPKHGIVTMRNIGVSYRSITCVRIAPCALAVGF